MADMTIARLNVLLGAEHTELDRALKEVQDRVEKTGKKLSAMGKGLTRNVTAPLLAIGAAGFKVSGDFEASLAKMEGLVGVQREQIDAWRGDIRRLAVDYGSSATEAADAMFFITSAGLRGSDALDTLEASLKAGASGLGDVTVVADLATSAMNAYGSDVLSAAGATDVLTAAVREGKLQPEQLAGAMGQVLPVASNMGIRFDEVGAAMAAMSRTGTNAQTAAVQLRQIMVSLLKPTAEAETALEQMGLSAGGLRSQIREQGLLATLETLSTEFEGNADAQAQVFGNVRALSGVMDLMGASAGTTAAIFGALADSAGATDEAFGKQITSMFKLDVMWASLKNLALELGNAIEGPVTGAIERVTSAVQGLTSTIANLPGPVRATAVALAGLAVVAGPILAGIGKLMTLAPLATKGIAGLASVAAAAKAPLVSLAAAKAMAAAAAGTLWAALAPALPVLAGIAAAVAASVFVWRKWGDDIVTVARAVVNVIRDRLESAVASVRSFATRVVDAFGSFREHAVKPVEEFVIRIGELLIGGLGHIIKKSAEGWAMLLRIINPPLAAALDAVAGFVDDTRKEMIRLRGSVEDESAAAGMALDSFRSSLADFSQTDLELTASGLGQNLIDAEKELDRLKEAQDRAAAGTVEDMQRATDAVARQQANVDHLRASYEAAAEAARTAGEAATTSPSGGGGGDGGAGETGKAIAEVREELEAALAEADGMGAALGGEFDVAAAKANAYETAVKELVAANVSLSAVVGPQGETLGELADRYLDLRSGVESALEAEQELTRMKNEGKAVTSQLMTAEEQRDARLARLDELLNANAISEQTHARAVAEARSAYEESTPAGERYLELLRAQDRVLSDIQTPFERYQERLALLDEMLNTVNEDTGEALLTQQQYNLAVAQAGEEFERATQAAADAIDPMREIGDVLERSMNRGLRSIQVFSARSGNAFERWAASVVNEISRVIARMLLLKALSSVVPGGSILATALSLPARATGGPVRGREPVLVGERGPEVFVPSGTGEIVANQNLRGRSGPTASEILAAVGPAPSYAPPEVAATHDYYRRLFTAALPDWDDRGGDLG